MRTQFRTLKFSPTTVGPVVELMNRYRYTSDSIFWFNIEPDVDERSIHTGSIFWKAFSSRGPRIPQFTWTSATDRKGNYQPSEIGLTHPTGIAVLERIKSFQINIPDEWRLIQDHPKRGIVFSCRRPMIQKKLSCSQRLSYLLLAHLNLQGRSN